MKRPFVYSSLDGLCGLYRGPLLRSPRQSMAFKSSRTFHVVPTVMVIMSCLAVILTSLMPNLS